MPVSRFQSLCAVCLPHLADLIAALDDPSIVRRLAEREASLLDRLAEDMRRYATKHDAVRRFLASDEELHAGERALALVAGLRHVRGPGGGRGMATPRATRETTSDGEEKVR
ncbi:MAG TPA: hypothetical protein VF814_21095 [Casimicrobiaceae bacterium]